MWIEVPIFCNTTKTAQLKDLGIDSPDDDFEARIGLINTDKICGCYPSGSNETTIINMICGSVFEVELSFMDFRMLLRNVIKGGCNYV